VSQPRCAKRNAADTPDVAAAALAARQWGVLDNEELWACGFSRGAVMRRRRGGILHDVFPGVYAWGHSGLTIRGRCLAAVKACGPGAALSYCSACALWRIIEWEECRPLDVTVPMRGARTIPGITIHRTRLPLEVVRLDGIPVTIPAQALLDLAGVYSYDPLRRAVREAMARKRVNVRDLTAIRGRRGSALLNRILADGYVPTRSELEDAVLDVIERGGLAKPDVNRSLGLVGGKLTIPDFRWPEQRLVVEADGRAWHDNALAREDDAERQARLEAAGERVVRVTWQQAIARPQQTIARLKAAGAPLSA
jgi:hypothetical protein